jgi:dihydrofolate synthase/folylpolyglutamate synthase
MAFTYDEALAHLRQLTNYEAPQPTPLNAAHFNPETFDAFLQTLGAPHHAFASVHIAGSKGKGSTAAMVAAMLQRAGVRTGLFSSPHLVSIRERTQINRQWISPDDFAALVAELRDCVDRFGDCQTGRPLTFFEFTTALSFLHFARQRVDIAVVEVGLGGRLDTTNVLTPAVAAITPIELEHTHILGDTLAAIAREKAGIIKAKSCVVSAAQAPEVIEVIKQRCQAQQATLAVAGHDFHSDVAKVSSDGSTFHFRGFGHHWRNLEIPLLGRHQVGNASVALAIIAHLMAQGWDIDTAHLAQGLSQVQWEGRLEILDRQPWTVCDAAFTVEAAQHLRRSLTELFDYQHLWLVLGLSADKNLSGIVECLATSAHEVIVTPFHNPRSCDPQQLASEVRQRDVSVRIAPDPVTALLWAQAEARPDDMICIAGSLFLLGEIKAWQKGVALEF